MKREELEEIPMIGWECYEKEEADSVMDSMERRIARLTWCVESWKQANADLQSENNRLRAENKSLKRRVKNAG